MSIKLLVQNREISKPLFFMIDTAFVHCSDAAKQLFVRFTGAIKTVIEDNYMFSENTVSGEECIA